MLALSSMFASVTLLGVLSYPLLPWPLVAGLAAYSVLLWFRASSFLLIMPLVLPLYDLGLWTGWMMVGESDLFVTATLTVLLARSPPTMMDVRPAAASGVVLLLLASSWLIATSIGMVSPLGATPSDNVFLRPDNALRIAKSLLETLALLPFLRQQQRLTGNAINLLGYGIAAGLVGVALSIAAERLLFPGIWDFSTAYRVAGPFSSMRVGGGHIGAYLALALPFSLCLLRLRPLWLGAGLATLCCLVGGYGLVVTFARSAYLAGVVGMAFAGVGGLGAANRRQGTLGFASILLVVSTLGATAAFTGMRSRFDASAEDLLTRQANWHAGLTVRDLGVSSWLFGMGLGTYQRAMLVRSPVNRPSDLVLHRDEQGAFASMLVETPFFLGQKLALPVEGALHLKLLVRSVNGQATLGVLVCDKLLLYSENCRGVDARPAASDQWQSFSSTLAVDGLGSRALGGLLQRPVELSLSGSVGQSVDVRDISLADQHGRSLLANGDFTHGLDHWVFTDDSHVSWRMLNQYLMLFFETGILGVSAFTALGCLAVAGGVRACRGGDISGAAIAGAVASFMISGLFDNLFEAPRLAALFFLICCCGLMQWEVRSASTDAIGRSTELRSKRSKGRLRP